MAFVQPLSASIVKQSSFTSFSVNHHFKSTWTSNIILSEQSRLQNTILRPQIFPTIVASANINDVSSSENQNNADDEMKRLIEGMEPRKLSWAEIDFQDIKQELDAIDELERAEELPENDPWPQFLRGAAYERWGQPKLALAQYSLTNTATGLRRVPELWERRAYNAFKTSDVGSANAYFDIATQLQDESVGNELHFVHWFYEHFQNYVPKRNGPAAPLQRAICKYCIGQVSEARQSLVPQIAIRGKELEHDILWLLASSKKNFPDEPFIRSHDLRFAKKALEMDFDSNQRMSLLIRMFLAAAKGEKEQAAEQETLLHELIAKDENADINSNFYLALYHDAFTNKDAEKQKFLDKVVATNGSSIPYSTEDFLYAVAKNRLTAPPGAESTEIPETTAH